jgi:hypothetical protein
MTTAFLSLILLALGADPQPRPELLPAAPPDWRFERIDFPLEFAPQLKYDGFEELQFAPGMFNAKSDTYFTYVFALKITNDLTIDGDWLKSFLDTYYRGLCKTVAEGTDFDIDVSKITATVREDHYEAQDSRHFSVTLASFDPFVTGKPLTLNLEILLLETSRTDHRVFAAVSPKPTESPVWKLLRKLKRQFHPPAADTGKKTK